MHKDKVDYSTVLSFIIVLAVGIFFCICKSGFYEDEIITYGLANSHNASWIYDIRSDFSEKDMTDNTLYQNEILSYLAVDEGQLFDLQSAYMNQTRDVHPPLYYILINIVSSFTAGRFTKVGPLCLNLIIWMLSLILLYRLCSLSFPNNSASGICVLLYGLCIGGLSNLLFIRMYILLSLFTILLAYGLVNIAEKPAPICLRYYIPIILTIAGGLLTHYNFLIIAFFMCFVFLIYFLISDKNKALNLIISGISGVVLFLVCFPFFFRQLLFGVNGGNISGGSTLSNILNLQAWIIRICYGFRELSNSTISIIVVLLILLIIPIFLYVNHDVLPDNMIQIIKLDDTDQHMLKYPVLILVSLFLSICSISIMNPIIIDRYYYFAIPLFSYIVGFILNIIINTLAKLLKSITNKYHNLPRAVVFFAVLLTSAFVLMNHAPSFLYLDYPDYISQIAEYKHSPVVYIASETYKAAHDQSLQFWLHSDDVFITEMAELDSNKLSGYLQDHSDNNNLILYIDTYLGDPVPIITSFMEHFSFHNVQPLFDTERTYVVRLY